MAGAPTRQLWQRLRPERWPLPLDALPADAALVGGAVRDGLLDRLGPKPDLDLVVSGDAIALCRALARRHGGSAVVLDAERCMARLVIRGWSLDLARQEGASLEADLVRRDYTVNAIALPLRRGADLVDPSGGLEHLRQRRLVAVSEANLLADPLRLLRGVRLAAQLGFALDPGSEAWIRRHHGRLPEVAPERVLQELEKLAAAPLGHLGLAQAVATGLLAPWSATAAGPAAGLAAAAADLALLERLSPERAAAAGLTASEAAEALPLARLAALFDAEALERLRSSRKLQQRAGRLRSWRQRLGADRPQDGAPSSAPGAAAGADPAAALSAAIAALPEVERLQLQRQLEADLPALLLAWPAELARSWLERWRDPDDRLFHPRPPLDGRRLQQACGLAPSPRLGELMEHLLLEQAFGRLHGPEAAIDGARHWLEHQPDAGA
ncbi:CCA tRNA nucleotidyltransferase [Vulcanococcus limneticus]|uniref:CCA tRNA nucleotidyltransferase n=1 Tax=Vulcanococcus limneticus TaxID=2170428 RepID=UPI00398BFD3B